MLFRKFRDSLQLHYTTGVDTLWYQKWVVVGGRGQRAVKEGSTELAGLILFVLVVLEAKSSSVILKLFNGLFFFLQVAELSVMSAENILLPQLGNALAF